MEKILPFGLKKNTFTQGNLIQIGQRNKQKVSHNSDVYCLHRMLEMLNTIKLVAKNAIKAQFTSLHKSRFGGLNKNSRYIYTFLNPQNGFVTNRFYFSDSLQATIGQWILCVNTYLFGQDYNSQLAILKSHISIMR